MGVGVGVVEAGGSLELRLIDLKSHSVNELPGG